MTFVRPDEWLGRWKAHDSEEALREVFRRFLSVYAPATRQEIARWWGVRPAEAARVLKKMGGALAEVEVGGSTRWVLASHVRALRSAPRAEGVRLLPSFDQLLVVSAPHSEAVVDPEHAGRVYRPRIAVWSLPAVLVDGRVRAAWKLLRQRDRVIVSVDAFRKLSKDSLARLSEEAHGVGALLGAEAQLEILPS